MDIDSKIEKITKDLENDIHNTLLQNTSYLINKSLDEERTEGVNIIRDDEKYYFPGQEVLHSIVTLVAIPLVVGVLTNYISGLLSKQKKSSDDNIKIEKIEKKIKELENQVSKKWPNKVDHDNIKNIEYLESEISKLLENWGWPKEIARSDAQILIAKAKNTRINEI